MVQKIYKQLQSSLVKLVPEKWKKIVLYASCIDGRGGEMFFYYYPQKLFRVKPVNCYEIPDNFVVEEQVFNQKLKELYDVIKLLNHCTKLRWSNITIIIKKDEFKIEYHFEDLAHSRYTDDQRRAYWCYKYLDFPLEALSPQERYTVENYVEETNLKPKIYVESLRNSEIHNQILK